MTAQILQSLKKHNWIPTNSNIWQIVLTYVVDLLTQWTYRYWACCMRSSGSFGWRWIGYVHTEIAASRKLVSPSNVCVIWTAPEEEWLSSQIDFQAFKTGNLPFTFFIMIFAYAERQNNCGPLRHQNTSGRSGTDSCSILITLTGLGEVDTNSVDKDRTVPGYLLGIKVRHVIPSAQHS